MLKRLYWVVLSFLLFAGALKADTVTIKFTGTSGNVDHGYYIDPYYGTVAGVPDTTIWCLDFGHTVNYGNTWTSYVTPLNSLDYSHTYYGGLLASPLLPAGPGRYRMAAYLFTIYSTKTLAEKAQIQWAVWNLFFPSAPDYYSSTYAGWYQSALDNMGSTDLSGWRILTDVAHNRQEFLQQVPEPATLTLLGTGLLGLGVLLRRRRSGS